MKKVNFKELKYVIPIFLMPVLIVLFYIYKDTVGEQDNDVVIVENEIRGINEASSDVKEADLKSKLEAYEEEWKDGSGITAIQALETEKGRESEFEDLYTEEEKFKILELEEELRLREQALKEQSNRGGNYGYQPSREKIEEEDPFTRYLNQQQKMLEREEEREAEQSNNAFDPVDMMKRQFAVMDSIEQSKTPEAIAARKRAMLEKKREEERLKNQNTKLTVQRKDVSKYGFNTWKKEKEFDFIKAIIDEEVTGYAGSRVRIRLLEDILIGKNNIKKGTYLYASINGFSEQRVNLKITGLMYKNKILPIQLSIYDMDGMEGLYVPASEFREFTKELGGTTLQGQSIEGGDQKDFLMSTVSKTFQSTSNAIAQAIRKNKVKLKYNSYIYLIDKEQLTEEQNKIDE